MSDILDVLAAPATSGWYFRAKERNATPTAARSADGEICRITKGFFVAAITKILALDAAPEAPVPRP